MLAHTILGFISSFLFRLFSHS
uniref:Uncharacterized protein n=1 Tax=Rhizophora mucronata TaxID=61149 RepID=A0A2P2IYW9_RHIMU